MQSNNQYFIKTKNGMIQLSKGAYLTIIKRQASKSPNTVKKTKKIFHHSYENTKTVKKPNLSQNKQKILDENNQPLEQMSFLQQHGINNTMNFRIFQENRIFSMKSLPLIDMQWDNDCESRWSDVYQGVEKMRHSLSMAIVQSFCG